MIKSVIVVGAGSAGLLAALALKRKIPQLTVTVLRDPSTPVIGVGESTTPSVPPFRFEFLKLNPRPFYEMTKATWKIGIHFFWGPRPHFEYGFTPQLDAKWSDLPKANGFYCDDDFSLCDPTGALMAHKKAFARAKEGGPLMNDAHAFHIYNPTFVQFLESAGQNLGILFIDGRLEGVEKGPQGVAALILGDGRRLTADLFVDSSGFRSELLGRAMGEPFISFASSLPCDRAIPGTIDRTNQPILPYTIAETMDAGWCWQIEHEHAINRGYVYCSSAISDDQAREEMIRKNPGIVPWDHVVKFKSGRYERLWVDNVVGIGNASGFVEPLEATALMIACANCQNLVEFLKQCDLTPTPSIRMLYNRVTGQSWDDIRNFLSLHYRFNTRFPTPFWKQCCAEADISAVQELVNFYQENGPLGLNRYLMGNTGISTGLHSAFGLEGYLVILVGLKVPYAARHTPTPEEWERWRRHQAHNAALASAGLTVEEALQYIRHPAWRFDVETQNPGLSPKAIAV
jgi:tryptophan halogenase